MLNLRETRVLTRHLQLYDVQTVAVVMEVLQCKFIKY